MRYLPLVATLLLVSCSQHTVREHKRPNILFILSDDHAKNAVSRYGSRINETPHIDRIGAEGITFTRAFVTNSICGPSRAVFITGKYSHLNGMRDNRDRFDGSQQTLPKLMHDAGYFTAVVGKWHLVTTPTGFDYWNILIDQGEYYNPDLIEMGDTLRHVGYATSLISDIAIETLDKRAGDKPFFMMVNEKAPHRNWMPDTSHLHRDGDSDLVMPGNFFDDYAGRSRAASEQDMEVRNMYLSYDMKLNLPDDEPETGTGGSARFDAKKGWKNTYDRLNEAQREAWDNYYKPIADAFYASRPAGQQLAEWKYQRYIGDYVRTIASVDENVGRLLDYLGKKGMLDNTLVIYSSDQGFFLGEHGWYDKRFMYEESIGIPLLMRFPPAIKRGVFNDELVLNLDVPSTILAIAGLPIPPDMQGRSLVPLFQGNAQTGWRSSIYYHYYEYPHGWHKVKRHYGIRTGRYKLIHFYNDIDDWEMYDLANDPDEMKNLYHEKGHEALALSLSSTLDSLIVAYGDTSASGFAFHH